MNNSMCCYSFWPLPLLIGGTSSYCLCSLSGFSSGQAHAGSVVISFVSIRIRLDCARVPFRSGLSFWKSIYGWVSDRIQDLCVLLKAAKHWKTFNVKQLQGVVPCSPRLVISNPFFTPVWINIWEAFYAHFALSALCISFKCCKTEMEAKFTSEPVNQSVPGDKLLLHFPCQLVSCQHHKLRYATQPDGNLL